MFLEKSKMKMIATVFWSLLVSSILLGCNPETKGELCLATNEGDAACDNPNRKKESYFRPIVKGDVITNPQDYSKARKWCLDQYEKRLRCERRQR